MYKTGNPVVFNTAKGEQYKGFLLKIDAFPLIDFVVVKEGFIVTAYELTTGLEVIPSQNFSIDEFVKAMLADMRKKGFTEISFFKKLKNGLEIKNESPSYKKWLQAEKQREDNLPFLYSPEEINQIDILITEATKHDLTDFVKILEKQKSRKMENNPFLKKIDINFLQTQLENLIKEKFYNDLKAKGQPLPEGVNHFQNPYSLSWQGMLDFLNEGRKHQLTKYMPKTILQKFFIAYMRSQIINKNFGYNRFRMDTASIQRIAIDNKKNRNTTAAVEKFSAYLDNIIKETHKINSPRNQGIYRRNIVK